MCDFSFFLSLTHTQTTLASFSLFFPFLSNSGECRIATQWGQLPALQRLVNFNLLRFGVKSVPWYGAREVNPP